MRAVEGDDLQCRLARGTGGRHGDLRQDDEERKETGGRNAVVYHAGEGLVESSARGFPADRTWSSTEVALDPDRVRRNVEQLGGEGRFPVLGAALPGGSGPARAPLRRPDRRKDGGPLHLQAIRIEPIPERRSGTDHDTPAGIGKSYGVAGRRFDHSGSPAGVVHQVNAYTTDEQEYPDLALFPDGSAVVVWDTESQGEDDDVFGRWLDADGAPVGAEFQINPHIEGSQDLPRVDVSPSGDRFVVVWMCAGTAGQVFGADCPGAPDASEISARIFSATGEPVTSHFRVNTYTTGIQRVPDVAFLDDGTFAVVWEGQPRSPSTAIHGRRFDAGGAPIGDQFVVSTGVSYPSRSPAIGGQTGTGLVAWFATQIPGTGNPGIAGRVIGSTGAVGAVFPIQTAATLLPSFSSDVDEDGAGRFVVAWTGYLGEFSTERRGPIVRQFCTDSDDDGTCDRLFRDGFESGDVSAWGPPGR